MNDDDLRREVERLRQEVDALHRRLEALEDSSAGDEPTRESEALRQSETRSATPAEKSDSVAETPSETPERPTESTEPSDDSDWESAVGIRWLGLVGALAVVVGVVFFVRLAIEIGLLGPGGRIAVGTLAGLSLFGGGRYAASRRGYVRWGRIAAGTGLAVAYFSIYAAYGFEGYRDAIGTPLWAVLVALTLLVAVTAALSIRDRTPLVAGEAFLLGYVTATISMDAATVVVTPIYALVLAAGLVAIATIRPWSRLVVSSAFASYGVVLLWLANLEPPAAAVGAVGATAFVLYQIGGLVLRSSGGGPTASGHDDTAESAERRGADVTFDRTYRARLVVLTVANAAFAAFLLEIAVRDAVLSFAADGTGTIAVAVALAGTYALTNRGGIPVDAAAAAGSVVFLAAGLGLAVGTFATTVGALAVIVAAVVLSEAVDTPAFRIGGHVVAGGLLVKLLAVDASELASFDASEPLATLTGRPVAFALAVGTFYALAWWFSRTDSLLEAERASDDRAVVPAAYAAVATGLGVLVLGLELSGVGTSIAWVLFGLVLLGIGFATDGRGIRLLGICVFGLATVKVFLFDTRGLDTVARTLSFLVLGAVLLATSYAYARFQSDLEIDLPSSERGDE
ncbi:DUF2339 domain-containing protein [Natrarchaeobius halalkaliphilus]|uniref:DUF2339 domain-containing protein n=1 Tax=Natrarchaeobius halalkaliphilus TaxID=1679091 RepID=A0A3N6LJT0_9EURY|nr:DUF2339 domain-containing protein [Natrarchaeobius halalkaliphilus]RQG89013.1 DUF2339 domain-containing protein [Natrarchaeobius halalkaliphilus]